MAYMDCQVEYLAKLEGLSPNLSRIGLKFCWEQHVSELSKAVK